MDAAVASAGAAGFAVLRRVEPVLGPGLPADTPPTLSIKRYETRALQPSLDALKRIALRLNLSLDELVFGDSERGPDETLKLKFDALRHFNADERRIAEGVLDSLTVQHQAKRLFAQLAATPTSVTATAEPPSKSSGKL